MEASDAELVRRCLQGDNAGFNALVEAYQKQLYCFCYRMLGDAEEAADAAQASFIKAYNALENFRQDASFLSWLFKIASNTCIDRTRARSRRPSMALDEMVEDGREPASDDLSPEESVLRDESNERVREAISKLPERYRASLVLFHFSGMSIKDISRTLGRPENTVKSDLRTAREKLRRSLEGGTGIDMNCEKARELIDSTLSGQEHIMAAAARDHVDHCTACQEWQGGMLRALEMLESLPEPQVPDISAMVMRQLPDAHPASVGLTSEREPLLRTLAWLGTGWVMVSLLIVVVLALLPQLLSSGWLPAAWSYGTMINSISEPVVAAGRALVEVSTAYATVPMRTSAAWAIPFLAFVLADCAVLAAVLLGWRRRGRAINACFI